MITRYYSGVPFRRTTISCVAVAFFVVLSSCARAATAAVTFPLEAKWSATLPAPPAFAPAFDAHRIYVPLQTKQLVALLINDGSVAWSVECPMTAAPAAGDGLVYAGSEDLIEARAESRRRARNGAVRFRDASSRCIGTPAGCSPQTEPGLFFAIRAQRRRNPLAEGFRLAAERRHRRRLEIVSICRSKTAGSSRSRSRPAMRSGRSKLAEPAVGILPVGDRVFVGARDNQFYSLSAERRRRRLALANGRRPARPARARCQAGVLHRARQHPARDTTATAAPCCGSRCCRSGPSPVRS